MSHPLPKQATHSQYDYALLTAHYALLTTHALLRLYNGYFTQWLRITKLRNEAQSQTFWRKNISIFGKLSFRKTVCSAKCPFGKTSVGKMSVRQNVFRQNVFRQSVFRQNVRVPHCPIIRTSNCAVVTSNQVVVGGCSGWGRMLREGTTISLLAILAKSAKVFTSFNRIFIF
jgi:hypothetical protein